MASAEPQKLRNEIKTRLQQVFLDLAGSWPFDSVDGAALPLKHDHGETVFLYTNDGIKWHTSLLAHDECVEEAVFRSAEFSKELVLPLVKATSIDVSKASPRSDGMVYIGHVDDLKLVSEDTQGFYVISLTNFDAHVDISGLGAEADLRDKRSGIAFPRSPRPRPSWRPSCRKKLLITCDLSL